MLEFKLIRDEELKPLRPLIDKLVAEDDAKYGPRRSPAPAPAVSSSGGGEYDVAAPMPAFQ